MGTAVPAVLRALPPRPILGSHRGGDFPSLGHLFFQAKNVSCSRFPRPCSSSVPALGIFKRLAASPEKHLLDGTQIGQSKCF